MTHLVQTHFDVWMRFIWSVKAEGKYSLDNSVLVSCGIVKSDFPVPFLNRIRYIILVNCVNEIIKASVYCLRAGTQS